jgi:hypothetical protein
MLYVVDNTAGTIEGYRLPLTSPLAPSRSFPTADEVSVASATVDARGDVFYLTAAPGSNVYRCTTTCSSIGSIAGATGIAYDATTHALYAAVAGSATEILEFANVGATSLGASTVVYSDTGTAFTSLSIDNTVLSASGSTLTNNPLVCTAITTTPACARETIHTRNNKLNGAVAVRPNGSIYFGEPAVAAAFGTVCTLRSTGYTCSAVAGPIAGDTTSTATRDASGNLYTTADGAIVELTPETGGDIVNTNMSSRTFSLTYNEGAIAIGSVASYVTPTPSPTPSSTPSPTPTPTPTPPPSTYQYGVWASLPSGLPYTAYLNNSNQSTGGTGLFSSADSFTSTNAVTLDQYGDVIAASGGNVAVWPTNAYGDTVPKYYVEATSASVLTYNNIQNQVIFALSCCGGDETEFCTYPETQTGIAFENFQPVCTDSSNGFSLFGISALAVNPANGELYVANSRPYEGCTNSTSPCSSPNVSIAVFKLYNPPFGYYIPDHSIDITTYTQNIGGLAFDPNASTPTLFVADSQNDRVISIDPEQSGPVTELGEIDGGTCTGCMHDPTALSWDGHDGVWASDSSNNNLYLFAGADALRGAANVSPSTTLSMSSRVSAMAVFAPSTSPTAARTH